MADACRMDFDKHFVGSQVIQANVLQAKRAINLSHHQCCGGRSHNFGRLGKSYGKEVSQCERCLRPCSAKEQGHSFYLSVRPASYLFTYPKMSPMTTERYNKLSWICRVLNPALGYIRKPGIGSRPRILNCGES